MSIQMDLSKKPKRKKDSQFMLEHRDGSVDIVVTHQEQPTPERKDKNNAFSSFRHP